MFDQIRAVSRSFVFVLRRFHRHCLFALASIHFRSKFHIRRCTTQFQFCVVSRSEYFVLLSEFIDLCIRVILQMDGGSPQRLGMESWNRNPSFAKKQVKWSEPCVRTADEHLMEFALQSLGTRTLSSSAFKVNAIS